MSRFTDQQYLKTNQYKDSSNLDARITIHQRFSTNAQGWYNWVFDELVKLPTHAKILELGCGAGTMWKECANRIPQGWIITLTDLSDGMLESAWRNLVTTGRTFKFETMDAQSISYPNETFDIVIANHMLYHVPDKQKALNEIKRVLKTHGCLIATTIGENHMREMNDWVQSASQSNLQGLFSLNFTLENGQEQLQEYFSTIELLRYPDQLKITEVEAMMTYIRSMGSAKDLSPEQLEKVENEIKEILEKEGFIHVTKDSGMFKALKK